MRQLYVKEFVWLIPNDDNRAEDGKALRYEFINEQGIDEVDQEWLDLGCSFLEMLIALARRAAFESDDEVVEWFWRFIFNLGLNNHTDSAYTRETEREVDNVLDTVIFRTYDADGLGGLFPLTHPRQDQRKVELWYQLAAYLTEGL